MSSEVCDGPGGGDATGSYGLVDLGVTDIFANKVNV